ncbi:MAG: leucyl/phenylalanyl-tRNA--protein transferase [Myxococcales bacterium]|nr:leucyl/phenylalanyl-tRNA--protein transferase [Myxococcales bacterium]
MRQIRRTIPTLADDLAFPDVEDADESGLLAVGGDLRPERLVAAYRRGIFPWPAEGWPLLWHAPDPRFVLVPGKLRINRSLAKQLKKQPYVVRLDTAFDQVIRSCATLPRPGQDGTWILPEVVAAYEALHYAGVAHCVESWRDGTLVGGAYGVAIGRAFFGESMFALAPDASKVAFATLARQLAAWGFWVVDCQVETPLLRAFGGEFLPRRVFTELVARAVAEPDRPGPWRFDAGFVKGET